MEAKTITGNKGGMETGRADVAGAAKKPAPEVQRTAPKELIERVCRTANTMSEVKAAIDEIKGMGDKETLRRMAMGEMGKLMTYDCSDAANLPVKALAEMGMKDAINEVFEGSRLPGARAEAVSVLFGGDLKGLLDLCHKVASHDTSIRQERDTSENFTFDEVAVREISKIAGQDPEKVNAELKNAPSDLLVYIGTNLHAYPRGYPVSTTKGSAGETIRFGYPGTVPGADKIGEAITGILEDRNDVKGLSSLAWQGMRDVGMPAVRALIRLSGGSHNQEPRPCTEELKQLIYGLNRFNDMLEYDAESRSMRRAKVFGATDKNIVLEALAHFKDDVGVLKYVLNCLHWNRESMDGEVVVNGNLIKHSVYATVLKYLALKMASGELSEAEWLKIVGQ